jgi:hypothetical protein
LVTNVVKGNFHPMVWAAVRRRYRFPQQPPDSNGTGASMSDPALRVGAPLLLAAIALVACYLPARKSLRIDPAVSLREE